MKLDPELKSRLYGQFKQLLALLAGMLLLLPGVLQAQFAYTTNSGTITITGYTGSGGAVTIPSTIGGLPVTSIGGYAFYGCTNLTSIAIPDSIMSIGDFTFEGCINLPAIVVDSLNPFYSTVDGVLFNYSQTTLVAYPGGKFGSYTIPASVTEIRPDAFGACARLTSVTIPDGVTIIPVAAFRSCSSLTNVSIPDGVTSLETEAFAWCNRLTGVTLPSKLTGLGVWAFVGCNSLTSITIPGSVPSIGNCAFYGCTSLTSVTIPGSVTSIDYYAFYACSSLTAVYFEGNAPSLGSEVFTYDGRAVVYYLSGTTGWGPTFGGLPTVLWDLPVIQSTPQTQTAEAGATVDLSAYSTNSSVLFYLWYQSNSNFISCSTNCDLVLTNCQFCQSGTFTVVVTNVFGAVTSAPFMLNVIPAVERRPVPGLKLVGEIGGSLNLVYATSLGPAPNWQQLDVVNLNNPPQYWFDLTKPLPVQRFYRAWQVGSPTVVPSLNLNFVPAITMTGNTGDKLRLDCINQIGPTDAWMTLDTVTLTNTSQLYFDTSALGQPARLYRILPVP